ncbi:MAG: tetratricopeptide repeat protein, partial [Candidatus Omnitrophica bacterium]|nr:tetratricopeptide repeat protein [Candidatus Omnitrophota bacterium]
EYKQVLRYDYHSPLVHLRLAACYIKDGSFDNSIDEAKIVVKLDPDALEPHALMALAYSLEQKLDLAADEYEETLRKASKSNPENIQIHKSLGEMYFWRKNFDAAEKVYKLILQISPNDAQAHFYLGLIYEEQAKMKDAIEEFKAAIKNDPNYAEALNSLGYVYAEGGVNLDEAKKLIEKALLLDVDNAAYVDSLGWVYFKKGMYDEALKHLEHAAGLLDNPVIYDHLGDVYLKKGLADKAKESWSKSLELDKEQDAVQKKLEQLNKTK